MATDKYEDAHAAARKAARKVEQVIAEVPGKSRRRRLVRQMSAYGQRVYAIGVMDGERSERATWEIEAAFETSAERLREAARRLADDAGLDDPDTFAGIAAAESDPGALRYNLAGRGPNLVAALCSHFRGSYEADEWEQCRKLPDHEGRHAFTDAHGAQGEPESVEPVGADGEPGRPSTMRDPRDPEDSERYTSSPPGAHLGAMSAADLGYPVGADAVGV